jgi:hypothetical protein
MSGPRGLPWMGILPALAAWAVLTGCSGRSPAVYAPPDYASWKRTTDEVLDYPIPGHQDRLRIPRMNDIGFSAKPTVENGKRRWSFPEGTVIVKEVFRTPRPAPGEGPVQLTIMVKASRDLRAQGGWLWVTRDLPGGTDAIFMGTFCITCHANANEKHPYGDRNPTEEFRDYVYFVPGEKSGAGRP